MVQPASLFSFWFLTLHLSVSVTFTLVNQCNYTVWPAALTNGRDANLSTTGFILKPGENSTVTASATWNGRFWGRTLCTTNSSTRNFSCVTGDCGSSKIACGGKGAVPPATLAEFGLGSNINRLDFYVVSLVDGYNIPMEVVPIGKCNSMACPADLNAVCPTELKVTKNEQVVACQGPCAEFNLQFFCCVGNYSTSETCEPSLYSQLFKKACPQAYSYAYDNGNNTFFCSSTDYRIIFCPASNNARLELLLFCHGSPCSK